MIEPSVDCTGCRACEQVCPTGAIVMRENEEGFAYPAVDLTKCVHCGLCDRHCHLRRKVTGSGETKAYATVAKDAEQFAQSASAGVFAAAAALVTLARGGCVFGCAYDEAMLPRHRMIERAEDLPLLQGSKYVESDLGDCYAQVAKQVRAGRQTLFCGTGCQVAGLLSYLDKPYDCLLTIDLICHGVPSRKLFSQHVAEVERAYRGKLADERFRSKKKPAWGNFCMEHVFQDGRTALKRGLHYAYYASFLRGETYRECCYACRYAIADRASDLTIGDYWGVDRFHPGIGNGSRVSAALAHTPKGEALLVALGDMLTLTPSRVEWVREENMQLCRPTARPKARDTVYRRVEASGYAQWARAYRRTASYRRNLLSYMLPRRVKRCAKALLAPIRRIITRKA